MKILAAEMIAVSWPLPSGTLLMPRWMSSATDAPYLGEACITYLLSRKPAEGVVPKLGGSIPLLAYLSLAFYTIMGILTFKLSMREVRLLLPKRQDEAAPPTSTEVPLPSRLADPSL